MPIDWAPINAAYMSNLASSYGQQEAVGKKTDQNLPVALVLPGITGTSDSNYITLMCEELSRKGFRPCVATFRGWDTPLKTHNFADFTSTNDIEDVLMHLKRNYPKSKMYMVGFSIGANVASKYAGMKEEKSLVDGLVSISNPFDVGVASREMAKSKNYIYGKYMAQGISKKILKNEQKVCELADTLGVKLNLDAISKANDPVT